MFGRSLGVLEKYVKLAGGKKVLTFVLIISVKLDVRCYNSFWPWIYMSVTSNYLILGLSVFFKWFLKDIIAYSIKIELLGEEKVIEFSTLYISVTQSENDRSCILLLRLQKQDGTWMWVHTVLQVKENLEHSQSPVIVCTNQVLK